MTEDRQPGARQAMNEVFLRLGLPTPSRSILARVVAFLGGFARFYEPWPIPRMPQPLGQGPSSRPRIARWAWVFGACRSARLTPVAAWVTMAGAIATIPSGVTPASAPLSAPMRAILRGGGVRRGPAAGLSHVQNSCNLPFILPSVAIVAGGSSAATIPWRSEAPARRASMLRS